MTQPPAPACAREGCEGKPSEDHQFCCAICKMLDSEMNYNRRLIERAGPGRITAKLWATGVSIADEYTEMRRLQRVCRDIIQKNRP
jgi:hypothetical protein